METELKNVEKEISNLEKQYQSTIDDIARKKVDLEWAQHSTNPQEAINITGDIGNLDNKTLDIATQLENANDKAEKLKSTIQSSKVNPENSEEVKQLTAQLEVLNSKLFETKQNTNDLKDDIKESFNQRSIRKFGTSVDGVGTKIDKFKKRVTGLFASAMIFNLLSSQLTNLRNKFISLLNTNDVFKSSLNQIKANLMTAFAPIYNSCLPAINSLMNSLSKITGTIAIFVSSLFGKSLNDAKKEAQGLSKALDKTKKSGDKASGSLSSIDKLEVIPDNSSSSSGNEDSGINYKGEIKYSQKLLAVLNKIKGFLSPIFNWIKEFKDEHGGLATAILVICGALAGLFILKAIKKLFTGTGKVLGGATADFTGFFNSLGKAASAIGILSGIALVIKSLTGLIETFSKSGMTLGQVAGLLGIVLGEVAGAFVILLGAITMLQPSWTSIAGAVVIFSGLALVLESVSRLIDTFSKSGLSLNDVIGLMSTILVTIIGLMGSIVLLGPAMAAGLGPFLAVVAGISAILIVMAATLPTILNAVGSFIEKTAPSLCLILETISKLINDLIYTLGTVLPLIINSVGGLFDSVFNGISKVIDTVGNTLVNILKAIGGLVDSVLGSLLKFIRELGPATETFVDSAIRAVTKLINFLISGIEYLVNTLVLGGVNKIIKGINSISKFVGFTIPTVPELSIPRFVPRLASGAVIPPRQEFAAILGDQKHGTNIETPAKLMADIFDERLAKFFEKFSSFTNDVKEVVFRNLTIVAQFGNRDFKKLVIEAIRLTEKELGRPLLVS